ncbi:GspE/PulE family protein [Candidatus Kaiserbacteria bacterium]|nr:GspE/PulE family protein [Candidatus Kaiserbacteria bacterium]
MKDFKDGDLQRRVSALRERGEEEYVEAMAPKYNLTYINLLGTPINPEALSIIPQTTATEAEAVIFEKKDKTLLVGIQNPNNANLAQVLDMLKKNGYAVEGYYISRSSFEHALTRYSDKPKAKAEKKGVLGIDPNTIAELATTLKTQANASERLRAIQEASDPEKVTHVLETLFGGALAFAASDIHIEPEDDVARIRYRVDGLLFDIIEIPHNMYRLLVSRLKLLSGLTLNIKDEAQDGRFTLDVGDRNLEVRTSVIPGAHGESIVMRILDPKTAGFRFEELGLNTKLQEVMEEELKRPNGAIITTGPTGSGKTTALYAFLQKVHSPEKKIITIEDPVEYKLPGLVQTQVEEDYTFASGLRSILRQDPDVIMVGEVRDRDVAETVTQAAQTGHLVFSTLHTNNAAGAFPRLTDLGVDYRSIGSAYNVVLGQRLVRTLCPHCKKPHALTAEEQKIVTRIMGETPTQGTIYGPEGCDACGGSGYKGRIGVFEAIRVDDAVAEAVIADPSENSILKAAEPQEIPSMQQDGVQKMYDGITSFAELERVLDLYNTGKAPEEDANDDSETDFSDHIV